VVLWGVGAAVAFSWGFAAQVALTVAESKRTGRPIVINRPTWKRRA
jgi:hypothetical protein